MQAAANFLTLLRRAVAVLQSADLKHIWVVLAFAQCGVGEDKARRLLKGQQPFLVPQNQIIGGNIIRQIRAMLDGAVLCAFA